MTSNKEVTTQAEYHVTEDKVARKALATQTSNANGTKSEATHSSPSPDWSKLEGIFFSDLVNPNEKKSKLPEFLQSLCDMLTNYLTTQNDRSTKVLDFHHPHQLKEMMSHCLDIHPEPRDLEQILSDCKETLKYCVKNGHPHFLNQLSTGADVVGVAATWLTGTANTNMFTYEVAPVFTLMEEVVLQRMRSLIGWEGGEGDGIFAPGGAIANLYGMLMARHRMFPDTKAKGFSEAGSAWVFTSEQGHFSIKKSAAILGIGMDHVVYVKCLDSGKMDVADLRVRLRECVAKGGIPMFVNATCGTTVLGAYDPVIDIADACQEVGAWLHCDGAWGGSVLMTNEHKHLLRGINRADSMTWNPHKMMGVPLQCSAFLTKHKGLMKDCNSTKASYLFQQDKNYDISYDTGDVTIQCGRHNDIFRLWLMWRAKGDLGFQHQINKNFELAGYLRDSLMKRDGFHVINPQFEAPNVCFWYLPVAWRSRQVTKINKDHLHKIAPAVKARMMEAGTLLVQYQPLPNAPNFFRVAISNPALTPADLDFLMDEIDVLGKDIPVPEDW